MASNTSSKIEQAIDDLEEYIAGCKPQFMSSTNIIVNREEIDELLRELRMKTPEEVKHYQRMISNREAILNDARSKAETMVNEARAQAESLVNEANIHKDEILSEHEIMQQAYGEAQQIVDNATAQAQEILNDATTEANSVRQAAMQYMEDMLVQLEDVLIAATQDAVTNYENLVNSMNHYQEIIQANRRELEGSDGEEPVPEETEEVPDTTGELNIL